MLAGFPRLGTAVAAVALPLALATCKGTEPTPVPTTVAVTPAMASIAAIGATQQFTAVVTDQNGNALTTATVTWSANPNGVVTVSAAGLATAVANGTAQVVATAGSANGSASVTVAQAPSQLLKISGDAQTATVGAALPQALVVQLNDMNGHAISSASVGFAAAAGSGSVGTPTVTTNAAGQAQTSWTLGTIAGAQTVSATVGSVAVVTFTATATAGAAASVAVQAGNSQTGVTGNAVATPPAVIVRDAFNNAKPGATVTFAATAGNGAITGATQTTNAGGIATVGSWTLGHVGTDTLTATVTGSGIGGNPVVFTATSQSATATAVAYVGDNQPGLVGYAVNVRPAVRVTDLSSNPVAGLAVTFAVASGGGSVTGAAATTNGSGIAQVGQWVLGPAPGVNTLTATVAGMGISGNPVTFADTGLAAGYPITLQPFGAGLPPLARTAFDSAVAKWQRLIYRPLSTVSLAGVVAGTCVPGTPALSGTTNGVVIYASVDSIDGPGKILAQAGPCLIRASNGLTVVGVMKFDSADIGGLISNGMLNSVVLHEMGHVIGFGTLWGPPSGPVKANCLQLPSTPPGTIQDTYFSCLKGQAAFDSVGGTSYTGGHIVPVENCGTAPFVYPTCSTGTVNGHWREVVFGNELMVGFLPSNPVLSVVTVAAQEDLGYTVNYAAADPYVHTFAVRALGAAPLVDMSDDIRPGPIYVVDATGTVVRVINR
jgi:hypothetical protein